MRYMRSALLTVAALLLVRAPIAGHHSFAAEYDGDKFVTMTGVVMKIDWQNPHMHFYLDVTTPQGEVEHWKLEGFPPNMLVRQGWKKDETMKAGDRVTVIGAGAVGCLCAWIAGRIPGCVVELVDVNTTRASVASSLGVRFATPGSAEAGADVVLHASATPEGLALALNVAGFESRIVELSWYGDRAVPVPLGASFHSRRLRIASSQVGVVARSQRSRWDTRRRMALALSLLADESLDALVTGESAFEDLPAIMPALVGPAGETICHRVRY